MSLQATIINMLEWEALSHSYARVIRRLPQEAMGIDE